ncbi:unnamed protein product [Acanthosepion pharaonis]|uniref:Uncharacterized protein n=1 Tax=Acanthosepion pharaonis TaxID=158019 RepID=A0A812CKX6_ACAPH|nr:unnamed protein product [Sepia pharaonis]
MIVSLLSLSLSLLFQSFFFLLLTPPLPILFTPPLPLPNHTEPPYTVRMYHSLLAATSQNKTLSISFLHLSLLKTPLPIIHYLLSLSSNTSTLHSLYKYTVFCFSLFLLFQHCVSLFNFSFKYTCLSVFSVSSSKYTCNFFPVFVYQSLSPISIYLSIAPTLTSSLSLSLSLPKSFILFRPLPLSLNVL